MFNHVEARDFLVIFVIYRNGIYSSVLVLREPWISRYFRFFTLNIGFLLVGVCFSLLPVVFVSGVFIHLLCLSLICLFWVCWVRENFSGGPGHIFSVWDSAVWSAGPVQFYLGTILKWMAGLYRFSLVWLCCSGYGTVEMVMG